MKNTKNPDNIHDCQGFALKPHKIYTTQRYPYQTEALLSASLLT